MIDRLTEADRPRWTELWARISVVLRNGLARPGNLTTHWQRLTDGPPARPGVAPAGRPGGHHPISCSMKVRGQ